MKPSRCMQDRVMLHVNPFDGDFSSNQKCILHETKLKASGNRQARKGGVSQDKPYGR
jgi:hypothetical protein